MADIDSNDLRSAVLQHAIGETASRGSGVKNSSTRNDVVQGKVFDCAFKLCSGSTHILWRRTMHQNRLGGIDHT
jgi:hypothetical protein